MCLGDIRERHYARVGGIALLLVLLTCAVLSYRGYEENQLKIAGSATIPESSSSDAQPTASMDPAVVSFNYNPDVSYGSTPPFDSADNPAYAFVWETIDELGLGDTSSPLQNLITPGDTVLIKPNLVDFGPGVFTRPEVVRPLVDMAVAAGATEIYIGDGGGKRVSETDYIVNSAKYSDMVSILNARHPGIAIEIVDLNVLSDGWHWIGLGSNSSFAGSGHTDYDLSSGSETLYNHTYYRTPDPQGVNPDGHPLGWYAVSDKVLDADVVINVPKMKTHEFMINTLAVKNLVGFTLRSTYDEEASDCMPRIAHWRTGSTGNDIYFNNDIFWRAISDVNKIVLYADKQGNLQSTQQRKYLNVIDGIQAMERSEHHIYGGGGLPYDRHVVLASVDPVAVDAVASRVMGYDFNYVPQISNAASDVLHPTGINNPGKIVILGGEIDSRLDHVFVFNDDWKGYAGSLAVTDFVPPTINTVSREGNTITANISGGLTAYVIYQIDGTGSILEMNKDVDTYSAILPSAVSQCLIRAQDEHFNTTSTIPPPSPTTTTVSSSNNPSVFGQSVTFTATVSPKAATGTVQFNIDGTAFGSLVTLSGGNATSSATSSISAGSHTISAAYGGDTNYSGSVGILPGGQTVTEIPSSSDATLSNLTISSGTLVPAFASGTTSYTDSVANSVSSVTVTPTANQSSAAIEVNGAAVPSGNASGSISLSVGDNTVTILVTAQDGTTTATYTVTVTRAATPTATPVVNTSAATDLTTTSATLNGNLTDLGTATSVTVSFEWGTTTSYGSETTAQSITAVGAFTGDLSGLTANTTYHFRAKAVGHGAAVYGEDMSFSTGDTAAPVITLVTAPEETASKATITWSTNEPATSLVEYGLTEGYGSFTALHTNLVTSHSVDLTGLRAGKTYHFRVISEDALGNEAVSPDYTFETTAPSAEIPVWAWVLIGLAVVGVASAAAFLIKGRLAQR